MSASLEVSKLCNDKAKQAETDYPGRFIAAAHAHPLGGPEAHARAQPLRAGARPPGVVITSEMDGKFIDDPALEPFWTEAERLGLFVFVHPALKLNYLAAVRRLRHRALGRPRVLAGDGDHPADQLRRVRPPSEAHRAHVASRRRHRRRAGARPRLPGQGFLGRARTTPSTAARPRRISITTSTTTWCSTPRASAARSARSTRRSPKFRPSRIVFATDYPQEVRKREPVRDFVSDIRKLGKPGEQILSGNVGLLLKGK